MELPYSLGPTNPCPTAVEDIGAAYHIEIMSSLMLPCTRDSPLSQSDLLVASRWEKTRFGPQGDRCLF